MLALITQREKYDEKLGKIDFLEQNYVDYYERLGLSLIPVPNKTTDLNVFLDLYPSLIILSGGNDISPNLYGGKELPNSSVSNQRDSLERKIVEMAIQKKIPLLGECRGMQFINVYFGGRLIEDLNKYSKKSHVAHDHYVEIVDEKFVGIFGEKSFLVNSYHNKGISQKELSFKLKVFAKSDGLIEGIYHPKLPIVGIMWHPEREKNNKPLTELLVKSFLGRLEF